MTQAPGSPTLSIRLGGLLAVEWFGGTACNKPQSGKARVHFVKGLGKMVHVPLLIAPFGALAPQSYQVGWNTALRTPIDVSNATLNPQLNQNFLLAWDIGNARVTVGNQKLASLQTTFCGAPARSGAQQGCSYLDLLADLKAVTNCPKAHTRWSHAASGYLSLTDGALGSLVPTAGLGSYVFSNSSTDPKQDQVPINIGGTSFTTLKLAGEALYTYGKTDTGGKTVTITITGRHHHKPFKLVFRKNARLSIVNLPRMLGKGNLNRLDHFNSFYACLSNPHGKLPQTPYLWVAPSQLLQLGDLQHCIMALVK